MLLARFHLDNNSSFGSYAYIRDPNGSDFTERIPVGYNIMSGKMGR